MANLAKDKLDAFRQRASQTQRLCLTTYVIVIKMLAVWPSIFNIFEHPRWKNVGIIAETSSKLNLQSSLVSRSWLYVLCLLTWTLLYTRRQEMSALVNRHVVSPDCKFLLGQDRVIWPRVDYGRCSRNLSSYSRPCSQSKLCDCRRKNVSCSANRLPQLLVLKWQKGTSTRLYQSTLRLLSAVTQ